MVQNRKKSLLTSRLRYYFADYSKYHRTKGNKVAHYFGITFILVSLLGLLSHLTFGNEITIGGIPFQWDAAILIMILGILWYIYLDWKLASPFSFVILGSYFLGKTLSYPVNTVLFISGWIVQLIGHSVYEKNSPAFFKTFTHLLTGPFWIFAHFCGYLTQAESLGNYEESNQ